MLKTLKMTAVALLASTSAYAADLPSKSAPLPPIRPVVDNQFYVGAFGGGDITNGLSSSGNATVGAVAGWQPIPFARLEGLYEYGWNGANSNHSNAIFANAIGQYPVGAFTPYALAGVGYRWSIADEAVWNVGAGVRYSFTKSWEADLRYRYISNFDTSNHQNVVTLGVNYRF